MELLGTVEEIACDGRVIICCSNLPDIGDQVFCNGDKLGTVGRVFGPVDGPYASITPIKGATIERGNTTFFKGRKRDGKDKRRNRRDRSLS